MPCKKVTGMHISALNAGNQVVSVVMVNTLGIFMLKLPDSGLKKKNMM